MGFSDKRVLREAEQVALRLELELEFDDARDTELEAFEEYPERRELYLSSTLVGLELMRARIAAKRRIGSSDKQTLDQIGYLSGRLHYLRAVLWPSGTIDDEVDLANAVVLVAPHRVLPLEVPAGLVALVGTEPDVRTQLTLSNRLLNAMQVDGSAVLVEALVVLLHHVAATLPADNPNRPHVLSNLGTALVNRFRGGGSPADLDRALPLHREARTLLPENDPSHAVIHSNIANVLRELFTRDQRIADLDEAISELRTATASDHPDVLVMLSNLCEALRVRYEHTGETRDLTQAVSVGRQAVAATPPDHRNRAPATYNLALALCHYSTHGGVAAINQALALAEEAAERGGPRHPDHQRHVALRDDLRVLAAELAHKLGGSGR
jgi:tetratricopeptide (TPR) repeat protein